MKVSSFITKVISGASAVSALACPHVQPVEFVTKFEVVTIETAHQIFANDPGFQRYLAQVAAGEFVSLNVTTIKFDDHISYNTTVTYNETVFYSESIIVISGRDDEGKAHEHPKGKGNDKGRVKGNSVNQSKVKTGGCTNPAVRVEWRNMKDEDKKSFVDAVRCLMDAPPSGISENATNRYEDLVWAHKSQVHTIHQSGLFLPWHRYYTHLLSRLIREECGYTAPFPWWDETKDTGKFTEAPLFTADYFGALPAVDDQNRGKCVTDGAFSGKMLHMGPGEEVDQEHCLSRGEDVGSSQYVTQYYLDTCHSLSTYEAMRECIEFGVHAYGHNAVGPVMAEVTASPSDPSFFMHHAFIDRNWKVWQDQDASRSQSIEGCSLPKDTDGSCPPLSMDNVISSNGLRPDVTVGDLVNSMNDWLCYTYDY